MIQALRNAWKMPEIRQKLIFTMGALIVYRLGSHVFVPGVDAAALGRRCKIDGALDDDLGVGGHGQIDGLARHHLDIDVHDGADHFHLAP